MDVNDQHNDDVLLKHGMDIYQHPNFQLEPLVDFLYNVVMEHEIDNFVNVGMKNVEFVDNHLKVGYDNVDIFLFHNLLHLQLVVHLQLYKVTN